MESEKENPVVRPQYRSVILKDGGQRCHCRSVADDGTCPQGLYKVRSEKSVRKDTRYQTRLFLALGQALCSHHVYSPALAPHQYRAVYYRFLVKQKLVQWCYRFEGYQI